MSASRALNWLLCIALLLAPLAMIAGFPASAHERAAAGHCADPDASDEAAGPAARGDCVTACAGILSEAASMAARPSFPAAERPSILAPGLPGLGAEAEDPPPRSS